MDSPLAEQVPDPGMAIKMAPPGVPDLAAARHGEPVGEERVRALIEFVDARYDCADFRVATLIALLHAPDGALTPELRSEIRRAVLGFAYRMDEPGTDAMCMFSENHQVLFAALEYLAGQTFPRERFMNTGEIGEDRRESGARRLADWFTNRFRFGYSEWNSSTYYEEDAAALALLVDFAEDQEIVARARVSLDLLFLDLALHSFRGRALGPAGRAYEKQKKWPEQTDVDALMAWAFPEARREARREAADNSAYRATDDASREAPDRAAHAATNETAHAPDRLSSLLTTSTYRVPEAIRAIAADPGGRHLRTSSGLNPAEIRVHFEDPRDPDTAGLQLWAMEAFTNPHSIEVTAEMLARWNMQNNAFLGPLAPFTKFRGRGVLPTMVRTLHPATSGTVLQRANVTTFRVPDGTAQLSSVQAYDPGGFGDQQHLWTLALPGDVAVFATHPGAPMFDTAQRGFSPSQWVGNGINPALGQDGGVLLARYDTRGRPGYLERRPRARRSHLFVPLQRLDAWEHLEIGRGSHLLVLASGGGYAAILTTGPITEQPLDDGGTVFVQEGQVTDWAVIVGGPGSADGPVDTSRDDVHDAETHTRFVAWARGFRLIPDGPTLRMIGPRPDAPPHDGRTVPSVWELRRGARLLRDGTPIRNKHPRFDTPWVRARRFPEELTVTAGGHQLRISADGSRSEVPT